MGAYLRLASKNCKYENTGISGLKDNFRFKLFLLTVSLLAKKKSNFDMMFLYIVNHASISWWAKEIIA